MTVYVVQKQMRFDHSKGELVPKFPELGKAKRWGDLIYLLTPTASPFNSEKIIKEIREKLATFNETDHLLLIGNPTLIGACAAIAATNNNGKIRCLQWSGKQRDYTEIFLSLW